MFSFRLGRSSRATVLGGLVALTASVVVAGGVSAKPLGAGPGPPSGNKSGAKACQNGGYNHYVTSDGASFTSEEECTSYAAKGGQLELKPAPTAQQICEEGGGTFETGGTTPISNLPEVWSCTFPTSLETTRFQALRDRCFADGGIGFGGIQVDVAGTPVRYFCREG